jgi:dihydrofolate reductase
MRKIKLYIAMSLDGYIAKSDGNIDFLESIPNPKQLDFGYAEFLASVDTTLMGNATYQKILSFNIPFPYSDKKNYVFSRNTSGETEFVKFINHDIIDFIRALKQQSGKDIWLIGGGQLNTLLLNNGLIDELQLTIFPIVLGEGIPLFASKAQESSFVLTKTESHEIGIVTLYMERR